MCNEYHLNATRGAIADQFAPFEIPIRWADAAAERPLDEPIRPTNQATMIRPSDPDDPRAGVEGLDVRWWLAPYFHKGDVRSWTAVTTTAPIETVDNSPIFREAYRRRRALIPLTSFIAHSEPPGWKKGKPKTRHEIAWPGAGVRYFAGIWDQSSPSDLADGLTSFAIIAGPRRPDGEPIDDRTPTILTLEQGLDWLDLDGAGKGAFAGLLPPEPYTVTVSPREQIISAAMRRALP